MENHEWTLKTADHIEIDTAIRARISTATKNIATATHTIENVLIPL